MDKKEVSKSDMKDSRYNGPYFEAAPAGPGKERFKPSGSGENLGGNAPQQDGTNENDHCNAGDYLWKEHHSSSQGEIH